MSWYWWALIYVSGWMFTFRVIYLRRIDATQRAVARGRHEELSRKSGRQAESFVNQWESDDVTFSVTGAFFWPLGLVYALARFIMFPRGVTTKFDRERKLLAEKKESEQRLQEAKKLLAAEGIHV